MIGNRRPPIMAIPPPACTQARRPDNMSSMRTPPESTRISLSQRLRERARERCPARTEVNVRHRGGFAYVSGELADGTTLPLRRLRYGGYANQWGFAIYLASRDGYQRLCPAQRLPHRHHRRSPRLRLRPLPRRPHRLAHRLTPDELRPMTTLQPGTRLRCRDHVRIPRWPSSTSTFRPGDAGRLVHRRRRHDEVPDR
jgi:hypothetical protein